MLTGMVGKEDSPLEAKEVPSGGIAKEEVSQPSEEATPLPAVKKVSLREVVPSKTERALEDTPEAVTSLEAKVLDVTQRLGNMEAAVGKLEQLGIAAAGAGPAAQVSPQQLQEIANRVQALSQEVRGISNKLQGTLGFDAYHSFKCDKCGSQGLVATVFKCTKCGQQGWRGWLPRKK